MLHSILRIADGLLTLPVARAHCDIPCKIYDPAVAIIATLSVVRMMDIIAETEAGAGAAPARENTLVRCMLQKEEEAEKVKHEVRVLWGDYFKAGHLQDHPEIHDIAHRIMQKASSCKQGTNRDDGVDLLELVNQFAELFWTTKGVTTARKPTPYPPSLSFVQPQL